MEQINKNIALLIDSENISYRYIGTIFDELKDVGTVTIRKLYGDLSLDAAKPWRDVINEYSIIPVQQFQYTSGKNSSDTAMVIDAMDMLYLNPIDVFCIVTSDSDFSRLVSRIRQSGKTVIGMGESKTPKALVNACDTFKYLNVLMDDYSDESPAESNITPIEVIENDIVSYIESKDNSKVENIGEIGSYLQRLHSDFDIRNYGMSKFSKFMGLFSDKIEIVSMNSGQKIIAKLKKSNRRAEIEAYVVSIISSSKNKTLNIGEVNRQVKMRYKDFNPKQYGYKQAKLFFTNIDSVKLKNANDLTVE
ncbi:MAG: NYN domain-containing protein [Eubacterium sp.]|nr:NYN domain-containing protein [Eubacterium sp.]